MVWQALKFIVKKIMLAIMCFSLGLTMPTHHTENRIELKRRIGHYGSQF